MPFSGPHDLRRLNVTQLAASGVDLRTLMNRMGHKTAKLALEVYAKADPGRIELRLKHDWVARSQCDVAHGAHGVCGPERCTQENSIVDRKFSYRGYSSVG